MEDRQVENPKLLDVEQVSDGWLKKYLLTYELPNGAQYKYESVSRKGLEAYRASLESNAQGEDNRPENADAVCILPILADGSVLLIREFRYAVNAWIVALPAGLLEPGETLEQCVNRELGEETGYQVIAGSTLRSLPQSGYSSVGMGDENVRVVIAQVEPVGKADLQPGEMIETFVLARQDIAQFLESNRDLIGTRCQLLLEALREPRLL